VTPVISDEPMRNHRNFHPSASNCLEGTSLRCGSQLRKKLLVLSLDSCRIFATRAAGVNLLLTLILLGLLGLLLFQLDLLETCAVWDAARTFISTHLLVSTPVFAVVYLLYVSHMFHFLITSIV